MTVKIVTEIKRLLELEGFKLLEATNIQGHYTLHIRHLDGRVQKLALGSSPKSPTGALTHTMQRVRRFARKVPDGPGQKDL